MARGGSAFWSRVAGACIFVAFEASAQAVVPPDTTAQSAPATSARNPSADDGPAPVDSAGVGSADIPDRPGTKRKRFPTKVPSDTTSPAPAPTTSPRTAGGAPPPAPATSARTAEGAASKVDAGVQTNAGPVVVNASSWLETWRVPVGSLEGDGDWVGLGQIAPRGSMIVVASRGIRDTDDPDDGVHVIDGRANIDPSKRTIRIIKSPTRPGQANGEADAVGVALDGDFVVFGTYGGLVTRVRLDGVVDWVSDPLPDKTRPGLPALVDVNGDGHLDVVVPIEPLTTCAVNTPCGPEWDPVAIALDGRSGKALWRVGSGSRFLQGEDADARPRRVVGVQSAQEGVISDIGVAEKLGEDSVFFGIANGANSPEPPRTGSVYTILDTFLDFDVYTDFGPLLNGRGPALTADLPLARPKEARVVVSTLDAPVQALPSVGDVDGDGVWDVLVVAGGQLRALSTGSTSDATRTLWRGDLQATGTPSDALDSPAAYASRVESRDKSRWLQPPRPPSKESFTSLEGNAIGTSVTFAREPVELEREPKTVVVSAQTDCGGKTYGTSEGSFVVKDGATWKAVPDAAWPVVAVACVNEAPVTEGPDGTRYEMREPWPWQRYGLSMLGAFLIAAAMAAAYTSRQRAKHPAAVPLVAAKGGYVRHAIVPDGARSDPKEALESQTRLLRGLLNVLDNDDTRPPLTLALYGAWGTGKSSVMQMLRSELKATGRYIDVWFNAWRYQRESDIGPALLQCIVDEVGRQSDWVTRVAVIWNRIRRATVREIVIVVAPALAASYVLAASIRAVGLGNESTTNRSTALVSFGLLLVGAFHRLVLPLLKVFSLDPAKLLSSDDSKKRIQFVKEFAGEFEDISRKLPDGTRLIVFIDDLDRCAPDRIVGTLETLSMLADTGSGFFVLAIDPMTVKRAVELTYKDLLTVTRQEDPAEAASFGTRYLEKMITLGVSVPILAAADVSPDNRLNVRPAPMNPMQWLWERIMPRTPLLVTLITIVVLVTLGFRRPDVVAAGLDFGSSWFASSSASAAPSSAPAPTVATSTAPAAATVAPPTPSTSADNKPPTPPMKRAPVLAAPLPPASVDGPPAETPSLARQWSQRVVYILAAVFGALLSGIALLVFGDALRRRKIRAAGPMGTDSKPFADAFAAMKQTFVETPRNVVRFTNLARFLYSVISERAAQQPESEPWAGSFFRLLEARWKGRGADDAPYPPWLKDEMDQWLPGRDSIRPSGGGQAEVPPPASSGTRTAAAEGGSKEPSSRTETAEGRSRIT